MFVVSQAPSAVFFGPINMCAFASTISLARKGTSAGGFGSPAKLANDSETSEMFGNPHKQHVTKYPREQKMNTQKNGFSLIRRTFLVCFFSLKQRFYLQVGPLEAEC